MRSDRDTRERDASAVSAALRSTACVIEIVEGKRGGHNDRSRRALVKGANPTPVKNSAGPGRDGNVPWPARSVFYLHLQLIVFA